MSAALIRHAWQVANNGGWAETFYFWAGAVGSADPLDGYVAALSLLQPGRPASEALVYQSTDAAPCLAVSGNIVALDAPRTLTAAWTPGVYDVQLRVFSPGADVDRYNLVGPMRLSVIEAPGA